MKTTCLAIALVSVLATQAFAQSGKIKIFNTTVKVKDVIGTTNLSTQKWSKNLPDVLVKHEEYYLETIGSYRDDYHSTDPNSLFNLVDKGSYPLPDEINMKYYDEVGIVALKSKAAVKDRTDFIAFCKEWDDADDYKAKKSLLFKNEYIEIGEIIQTTRFQFTTAPYTLKQSVIREFNTKIETDVKANLKANNITASASLINYLTNLVTSQTEYSGTMIVAEFNDGYMTRLKNALSGLSKDRLGKDDFSIGLKDYAAPGSQRTATTGLVVFKLNGKISKSRLTETNLKADLKAKFKALSDAQIGDIVASVSIGFVSKIERLFTAEIDNIYIASLLTSNKIDQIDLDETIKGLVK